MLIAHDGRPVLSDFGLSRLLVNSMTVVGTMSLKGVTRWMAPELIEPGVTRHACHTKATDVWAFGMVTYVCSMLSANVFSLTAWSGGISGKCSILRSADRRSSDKIDHEWNAA